MKNQWRGITWVAAGIAVAGFVAACGGGGSYGSADGGISTTTSTEPPLLITGSTYSVTNLVSNGGVAAARTDLNLKNAWGLAFNPKGFVWVSANGTSKSTLYDGNGVPQTLVVSIPAGQGGAASPTGIVFNPTQDFKVSKGSKSGTSAFIFVGEAGTVSGWSPSVDLNASVTRFDGGSDGKIYKGLAIANYGGANYLYATDFHNGTVDTFDGNFVKVSLPGGFSDSTIPADYAPYGIQAIGNRIYVSYAKRAMQGDEEVKGSGLGIIDVFDAGGYFINRLATGGVLNAAWGMAMAPANFGSFSNHLLVANFGDGRINAFEPDTGAYAGTLTKPDGAPVSIDGLWGIAFGNGINNQPVNTLFFTAGPDDETHGLYGRIDLQ